LRTGSKTAACPQRALGGEPVGEIGAHAACEARALPKEIRKISRRPKRAGFLTLIDPP
jgi:hypothetical protein